VNSRLDATLSSAFSLSALLFAPLAQAQLGPNGSAIQSSQYAVDLFQGPVTASTRVVGMGGAYDAIAESSEGNFVNPAGAAIRLPWSYTHLDYDLGGGIALSSFAARADMFNSGTDRTNFGTTNQSSFVFLDVEGDIQWGPWAVGTAWTLQQFGLQRSALPSTEASNQQLHALFAVGLLHIARSFVHGQLLFGAGIRYTALNILSQNVSNYDNQTLFTTQGVGLQFGWLWRPHDQIFRLGASVRSAVRTRAETASFITSDASGNRALFPETPDQMYLPNEVALPWDWSLGFAVQFGSREFNPRWTDPQDIATDIRRTVRCNELEREQREKLLLAEISASAPDSKARRARIEAAMDQERKHDAEVLEQAMQRARAVIKAREKALKRWYLLTATSLKVSGPVQNAVGVESFLQRVIDRSGDHVVASPHLGFESEVIPYWLKLRAGLYGEPTRFSNGRATPRVHSTAGFEVKMFGWSALGLYDVDTQWRVQASVDTAQRYLSWSASIGVWH
jgi:hypothetical protein